MPNTASVYYIEILYSKVANRNAITLVCYLAHINGLFCNSMVYHTPHTITSFQPALLAQLIPNTTATHTITYTNYKSSLYVMHSYRGIWE